MAIDYDDSNGSRMPAAFNVVDDDGNNNNMQRRRGGFGKIEGFACGRMQSTTISLSMLWARWGGCSPSVSLARSRVASGLAELTGASPLPHPLRA